MLSQKTLTMLLPLFLAFAPATLGLPQGSQVVGTKASKTSPSPGPLDFDFSSFDGSDGYGPQSADPFPAASGPSPTGNPFAPGSKYKINNLMSTTGGSAYDDAGADDSYGDDVSDTGSDAYGTGSARNYANQGSGYAGSGGDTGAGADDSADYADDSYADDSTPTSSQRYSGADSAAGYGSAADSYGGAAYGPEAPLRVSSPNKDQTDALQSVMKSFALDNQANAYIVINGPALKKQLSNPAPPTASGAADSLTGGPVVEIYGADSTAKVPGAAPQSSAHMPANLPGEDPTSASSYDDFSDVGSASPVPIPSGYRKTSSYRA